MPEDAPVNTGAAQWPDEGSAYYAVRRMQTKLHRWAGEDPSRRFGDLYNLIYDPAFLRHAWQRVSSNAGARTPGVDRATVARIETLAGWRAKRRQNGLGNWRLIRFADDFAVMVSGERHHAEALREEVAAVLAPLGLRLSLEKTRVVHIDEGFVFLGMQIRRMRKRGTQKYYVYTKPSKKAIQAIKDKVKAKTYRSTRHMALDELIASLNQTLAGWANHFRHGTSKATFNAVDHHAWGRIMRWIRAKYAGKHRLGMAEMRRRFCDQGWRFGHNGVVFTGASSVAVTRYRFRGRNIPTPWTTKPAAGTSG